VDLHAAAHVFVADLDALELEAEDAHHLSRVLRLRPGEPVTVADGTGGWRPCRWTGNGVEPDGAVVHEPRTGPALTIGFAVPKGDRPEWIVQKLTELDVDHIVLLRTDHSVVRWDAERSARHVDRLRRVAREASMQSRRVWLPRVEGVRTVAELDRERGRTVAIAQPGGAPPSLAEPTLLVGPEGGWSEAELAGRPHVGLGPTVLRVETAAISAGILLRALRAGIVGPISKGDDAQGSRRGLHT
jgi:16S rRNA (uracil1498-N3)-methyltransferase